MTQIGIVHCPIARYPEPRTPVPDPFVGILWVTNYLLCLTGDLRRTTAPPRKLYWFFYFFGFWFWVLGCSLSEGWLLLLVCLGVGGVGSLPWPMG